jgi:hypothetical protein
LLYILGQAVRVGFNITKLNKVTIKQLGKKKVIKQYKDAQKDLWSDYAFKFDIFNGLNEKVCPERKAFKTETKYLFQDIMRFCPCYV